MIVVVNRLQVPEGGAERMEQGFRHAGGMKDVPGCERFELWRSEDGREFHVVTHWASRADFDMWRQSEGFRHAHRDTRGSEQIQSSTVVYEVALGG